MPSAIWPRLRRPNRRGGLVGEIVDRLLHRHEAATTQALGEELGRVGAAAHAVEVGAGVGAGHQDVVVVPDTRSDPPGLVVVARGRGPQHRAELVGDHDVDSTVERAHAASCRDVSDRRPRGHRWRAVAVSPMRYPAKLPSALNIPAASLLAASSSRAGLSELRSACMRSAGGRAMTSRQPGMRNDRAVRTEAHGHGHDGRHRQCDDPPTHRAPHAPTATAARRHAREIRGRPRADSS